MKAVKKQRIVLYEKRYVVQLCNLLFLLVLFEKKTIGLLFFQYLRPMRSFPYFVVAFELFELFLENTFRFISWKI